MTYDALEESRNLGSPAELYYFRFGSDPTAFYAYTDVEEAIIYGGVTYNPIPIKRGGVVASGSLDKSRMSVRVPLTSAIAELFRVYPPGQVITLTLRGGHTTDTDVEFPVIWVGRVLQCSRNDDNGPEGDLSCEPASTSIRRSGLRRHYQLSCPHVLYEQGDGLCKANKTASTFTRATTGVAYTSFTFSPGWNGGIDPAKFLGGMVTWVTPFLKETRTILRVSGNTLILTGPTTGVTVGGAVDIILGCNHQTTDCEMLHNNILNFGGQPYIPLKNPIASNPFN